MVTGPMLLVLFVIAVALLLFAIIALKLDAFIALEVVAILTGFMVKMPLADIAKGIATGFGNTMGSIGIVIGLGVILGRILEEAGATEQIANGLLKLTGKKNAPLAVNLTGYLVSIPVFFDAAFVILISLIREISRKTKISFTTFVTALAIGLIVTHAMVIPTPGPVAVAGNMGISMGFFTLYAIIASLPASLIGGWLYGLFLGKKYPFKPEEVEDEIPNEEEKKSSKPSFGLSLFVLLLPIILILLGTILSVLLPKGSPSSKLFSFIGDKNIAMLIGVIVAMISMKKYLQDSLEGVITRAIAATGVILLITGAGGSFGNIINSSGIGAFIVDTFKNMHISVLIFAFLLSQVLRAAQGSTTVALITTSSILGPMASKLGVSPILVALAICAGGIGLSLPNDSGFWVVSKFSKFDTTKTMEVWTLGGTITGVTALIVILILSSLSRVLPGLH